MEVYLNYNSSTEILYSENTQWGFTERETTYEHIHLSTNKGGEYDLLHVASSYAGNKVYYCYAIHSSGDTFNRNRSEYIEALFVCLSAKDATDAHAKILASDSSSVTVSLDGKDVEIYLPWHGYFESLDEVVLDSTTL